MPTLTEMIDSRETRMGRGPDGEQRLEGVTLHYKLDGTSDDATARTYVKDNTPTGWPEGCEPELVRDDIRIEPEEVDTGADTGTWDVEVDYVLEEESEPEVGESSYSFDTGGGTQHLTQSLETRNKYAPPAKTAPDFKGAIGVRKDAVEGVDVTMPVYNFSETHYLSGETVTPTYKGKLFRLTGRTNNDTFKGLTAGECLFLGASGSKRGQEDWEITYRFAASSTRTNITIGDITVAEKKGWDYLWVLYEDVEDDAAKKLTPRPIAAYVEKVYEEDNFGDLGIGT